MGLVKHRYFFVLLLAILLGACEGNIFSTQPKSQLVPEGSTADVIFECKAGDEIENPTYEWRKDKKKLAIEGRLQLFVGNLHISQPQDGDDGTYQCVVSSYQGVAGSNEAEFEFEYLKDYPPSDKIPQSTIESKGVILECGEVKYAPEYSVYFYWEETVSFRKLGPTGNENMYISQNTGNLYLSNPKTTDSGSYQCQARARWDVNGKFARASAKTTDLDVRESVATYEPTFLLTPDATTYAELNRKTFIECFATGNPTPTNSWTFNGGPLPEGTQVTPAGQLLFESVQKSMEGTYTCTAENDLGSKSASGNLFLQYPPVWEDEISSVSADLTTSVTLTCSASAEPAATYEWWKNGNVLVQEDDSPIKITNDAGSTTLEVSNLEEEHAGIYQCVARNKFGNAVSSALLEVNSYEPDIEDLPPLTSAALGEPITIPCTHTAAPAATISWTKDGVSITEGERYKISGDGSLTIDDVEQTDEGTYSCTAQNMLGSDSSQGSLKAYMPTSITTSPKDVELVAGSSAEMSCSASHDPALTLRWHWYHDDIELVPIIDAAYFIEAGQLTIKAATSAEGGTYRCCAETNVGTPCEDADVSVTAPPNPPTGITVLGSSSDSQFVSWDEPFDNYSPITHYTIEVKDSYNEEWTEADTEPEMVNTTSCKVIGLYPYNDYNYRIYAHNNLGSSEASDPSPAFATSKGPPKKAPSRVRGGGGELGELIVTWEPLAEEYFGDEHVSYVVAIRRRTEPLVGVPLIIPDPSDNATHEDPQEGPWTEMTILDEKQSNCTFTVNITEIYIPYEVKIRADNQLGEGPWSQTRIVRTAELSPVEAPEDIKVTKAQAHVASFTWKRLQSKNGFIQGYFVKVEPKAGEPTGTHMKQTASPIPAISVEGLSPNTVYRVTICGFNSAGQGPWSEGVNFNTAKKPPSRSPEDVKVSIKGTVVSASWKPITDMSLDEAILLGYKVQYWWSNRTTATAVTHTTTETSMNFQVPNNSLLNVWIRGYSSGGDGNPSTIYYVSSQSTSKEGYISCCGAEAITFNSATIIFITLLWFLFVKLDV